MLREENGKIYYDKPYDPDLLYRSEIVVNRPVKTSKIKKDLREKIAGCKLILRCAGPGISQEHLDKCKKDLAKYERQLATIEEGRCHKTIHTYKKLPMQKIREYTIRWIEDAKAHDDSFIRAEDIAYQLNVKPHFVKQVLQQLNVEGVVYQPEHHAPHDSPRDHFGYGNRHAWTSDIYYLRYDEEESEEEE